QALDVGDLLLRLELTVRVADFRDVGALRRLVFELGAGALPPIIAAPTAGIGDLERLGAAILLDVLHVLDAAPFVRGEIDLRQTVRSACRGSRAHLPDERHCARA